MEKRPLLAGKFDEKCLKIHFNHDFMRILCTDLCISSIQARGTRNAIVSDCPIAHSNVKQHVFT